MTEPDVGITLLSAENLRTGFVWRHFMRNKEIPRAMRLIGLNIRSGRKGPILRRRLYAVNRLSHNAVKVIELVA